MNMVTTIYMLILFCIAFFSTVVLFARGTTSRIILGLNIVIFMSVTAYLTSALTGYPRNIERFEQSYYFFEDSSFVLKDFILQPDRNIYLWLVNPDQVPMSFRLDWDENLAEQLHQAQEKASQTGGEIEVDLIGDGHNDDDQDGDDDGESSATVRVNQIDFFIKD